MRRLNFDQIAEIEPIARQCFEETKQPDESFDFEHFCFSVEGAMKNGSAVLWVEGSPIYAFLLANYVKGLFGGTMAAHAVSRFVKPEYRSMGLGRKFMEAFREEGKRHGVRHYYAGHPFTVNKDGNKTFFENSGWRHVENLYRLDV